MNQAQFIQNFSANPKNVLQFNKELFKRDDNEITYYLKLLYQSIQREMGVNSYYTIRINSFTLIEDYESVRQILSKYQEAAIKKSVKLRGVAENRFNFIDLRESDVKILIVEMYLEAYDGREIVESVIAIPRIVNGQYIQMNGNLRQMMLQLVDASTYNNQTSNSKNPMVVFKSSFQPVKIYRNIYQVHPSNADKISTINGEDLDCVNFDCDTFSKSLPACEYIFARMGLAYGLRYLGLDGAIWIHTTPPPNEDQYYIFKPTKLSEATPYYVAVPRQLYNANPVLQHVVYTIVSESCRKFMTYENIMSQDVWLEALGRHFSLANPINKSLSVLSSFEMVYDLITRSNMRLPADDMKDSYSILRWLIYEFNALTFKSNLDVYRKRVRSGEYAAYLIAPKLFKAICTLSDMGERVNLAGIKKRILIPYDYMMGELGKESIVVFNDMVTDCDSTNAIKYSRNGPSAISDSNSNASLPVIYRYLHPTSLGVLCPDSSGASNPGISGILCALANTYEGGYFDPNYKEPSTWRERVQKDWEAYDKQRVEKEVVDFKRHILEEAFHSDFDFDEFKISEDDRLRLLATANR